MRFITFFFVATLAFAAKPKLADIPDPLVGTDSAYELSHGNLFPGVFVPWGMINWTPQTGQTSWAYQYKKDKIQSFLAMHRPSVWTSDYGPFSLMPVTGDLKVLPEQRASKFDHKNETARPYYYSVFLDDSGVKVEMAPTMRGGIFRFTFPKGRKRFVVIDASRGGSGVEIPADSNLVLGFNKSIAGKFPPNFIQHFTIAFDHKFKSFGTWDDKGEIRANAGTAEAEHAGGYVEFDDDSSVVIARVSVSIISRDQARENWKQDHGTEPKLKSFDQIAQSAADQWDRELGRIEVQGGTEAERRTFYTAMYHCFQYPRVLHEVTADGKTVHFSAYDGKIHEGEATADTGFWDTFRAYFPLLTIIDPKKDAEIIRAVLNASDEGGWVPKWPNPGYTNIMIGTHGDSVIADAYVKGIRDYDISKAYAALRKDATEPGTGRYQARRGIEYYLKLGYIPYDKVPESVARTLEDAYDDYCVAQMAKALGKADDHRKFLEQSKNYRNMYDRTSGFMRGRKSDGAWLEPFDPLEWGGVYTEGNAYQWLWSVQHDVPGLIELLGGREAFIKRLDDLFTMTNDFKVGGYKQVIHEMTEAKLTNMGQYAHINEPVHHVIYLYDYAGQPWKAQKWAREVMDRLYKPGPDGWLGDEDTGQMSAWYIFSAMGFYPTTPGQPVYALGSPLFDSAAIRLPNGKTFEVKATRTGPGDRYVQSVTLHGKPLERCWITHDEIVKGGTMQFRLGPQPNEKWGTGGMPVSDPALTQ